MYYDIYTIKIIYLLTINHLAISPITRLYNRNMYIKNTIRAASMCCPDCTKRDMFRLVAASRSLQYFIFQNGKTFLLTTTK